MAVRHWQWHLCIKQCKRATDSGTFALAHPDHNSLPLDQHYYCRSTTKDVTSSDVFTKTSLAVTRLLKDATDSDVLALRH
jgi:hypothetical protein